MGMTDLVFVATSQDSLFQETRDHLAKLGYSNCARFSSGKAAVEFIKFNPARIIIVDTEVEDLTIAEFVSALREVRAVVHDLGMEVFSHSAAHQACFTSTERIGFLA